MNLGVLASAVVAGIVILVAGRIKVDEARDNIKDIIACAIGVIISVLFLHLLPEVMSSSSLVPRYVSLGSFLALVFLGWFTHEHEHDENHDEHKHTNKNLIYLGQAVHSLSDGVVIYTSFLINSVSGILVAIAILSHHIPMVSGLILRNMKDRNVKAKMILISLLIPGGAILASIIGNVDDYSLLPMAFSTASFMYSGGHDLIEYLNGHKDDSAWTRIGYVLVGVTIGVISEMVAG